MCIGYKFSVELLLLCRYRTNKNAGCIASIASAANIIDVISIRIRLCSYIICKRREGRMYIHTSSKDYVIYPI